MTKAQVITELAKARTVEDIVDNIAHADRRPRPELRDLSQMVYCVLLDYDEAVILDLWNKGQMRFFIARIILNQYRSKKSTFFKLYHKEQQRATDLADYKEDGQQK